MAWIRNLASLMVRTLAPEWQEYGLKSRSRRDASFRLQKHRPRHSDRPQTKRVVLLSGVSYPSTSNMVPQCRGTINLLRDADFRWQERQQRHLSPFFIADSTPSVRCHEIEPIPSLPNCTFSANLFQPSPTPSEIQSGKERGSRVGSGGEEVSGRERER